MEERHEKKIEEIMTEMDCPKDFECHKSDFKVIGKARRDGLQGYVWCLEDKSRMCKFKLTFGDSILCRCSLRIYLTKSLYI